MRKIVTFDHVSADGYFTDPQGGLRWVVQDPELDRAAGEAMGEGGPGTLLFGRRTYEQFESFWPHALDSARATGDQTAPNPHQAAERSQGMHAMATWLSEATKIVFSKTRKEASWKNTRFLSELDPRALAAMKAESGGDIMIFGSGTIVTALTKHGLIDEYEFVISPLLLGNGRPLVSGLPSPAGLKLLKVQQFPTGNVKLRYARAS